MKPKGDGHPKTTLKKVLRKRNASSADATKTRPPKRKPFKGKDQLPSKNLKAAKKSVHNLRNVKDETTCLTGVKLNKDVPHFLRRHSLRSQNNIEQDAGKKSTKSKSKDKEIKPSEDVLEAITTQPNLALNDLKLTKSEPNLRKKELESTPSESKPSEEEKLLEKNSKSITSNLTELNFTETVNVQKKHYNLRHKRLLSNFDHFGITPSKSKGNPLTNGVTNNILKENSINNNLKNSGILVKNKFALTTLPNNDSNNDVTMLHKHHQYVNNDNEKMDDPVSELSSSDHDSSDIVNGEINNNTAMQNLKNNQNASEFLIEKQNEISEILENIINAVIDQESSKHVLERQYKTNAVIEQENSEQYESKVQFKTPDTINSSSLYKEGDFKNDDLRIQNKTNVEIQEVCSKHDGLEIQTKTAAFIGDDWEIEDDDLEIQDETRAVTNLKNFNSNDKSSTVIEQEDSKHDLKLQNNTDAPVSLSNKVIENLKYESAKVHFQSNATPKLTDNFKTDHNKSPQFGSEDLVNKADEKPSIKSSLALKEYRKPKHGSKIDTIHNHLKNNVNSALSLDSALEKSLMSPQAEVSNEFDKECNSLEKKIKEKLKSPLLYTTVNTMVLCSDQKTHCNQYKTLLTDQDKVLNQNMRKESIKNLILRELEKSNGKSQLNIKKKVIEINTLNKVKKKLLDAHKKSSTSALDKEYSSKLSEVKFLNTMATSNQHCSLVNKSLKEKILDIKQEVDSKKSLAGPTFSRSEVLSNATDKCSVSHSKKCTSDVPSLHGTSNKEQPCTSPTQSIHIYGPYDLNKRLSKANKYIIKKPPPIKLTARKGSAKNICPDGAPTGKLSLKSTLPTLDSSNMHTHKDNIPTLLQRERPNSDQPFSKKVHTPSNPVSKTDCHHCLLSRKNNTSYILSQSSGKQISQNDETMMTQERRKIKPKKSDGIELSGVKKQPLKRKKLKVTKNDLMRLKESRELDTNIVEESITTTTTVKRYNRKKKIQTTNTKKVNNTTFTYQQSCTLNVNQIISNQEHYPLEQNCPHNLALHKCLSCSIQSRPYAKKNVKQCNSVCSVCGFNDTPSCRCIGSRVKFNQQRLNPNGFRGNGLGLTPPSIPHIEMSFPQYLYDSRTRPINAPIIADFMENKVCPVFHNLRTYSRYSTIVPYDIRIKPIEAHQTNPTWHQSHSESIEWIPVTYHNRPNNSYQNLLDRSQVSRCNVNYAVQNCVQNNLSSYDNPSSNDSNNILNLNSAEIQPQNPTFTCCGYKLDSTTRQTQDERIMNYENDISSNDSFNSYQNITAQTQHKNKINNYASTGYSSHDEYIPNGFVDGVAKEIIIYNGNQTNAYNSNESLLCHNPSDLNKHEWQSNNNVSILNSNNICSRIFVDSNHINYSRYTYHNDSNMHINSVNESLSVKNIFKNQVDETLKIDSIIGRVEEISSTPEVVHAWDQFLDDAKISPDNDLADAMQVKNSMDHSVKSTDLDDACKSINGITREEKKHSNENKSKLKNDFDHIIVCGAKELYENETLTPKLKNKIIAIEEDQKQIHTQGGIIDNIVEETDQLNEPANITGSRDMDDNIIRCEEITTDGCPSKNNANCNEDHIMIALAELAEKETLEKIIKKTENETSTEKDPAISRIVENIEATAVEIEFPSHGINGIHKTERLETIQSFDNSRTTELTKTTPNTNESTIIQKGDIYTPKLCNVTLNDEESIQIEDVDFGMIDIEKYLDAFGISQDGVSSLSPYNNNSCQMDTSAHSNYQNERQKSSEFYSSPYPVPPPTVSNLPNPASSQNLSMSPDQSSCLNGADYSWLYSNLASYIPQDADALISSIQVNTFLDSPASRPGSSLSRDKARAEETPRSVRKSPISIRSIPNKIKIRHQPNEDNYIRVQQSVNSPYQRVNIAKDAARSSLLQTFEQYNSSRTPSPARSNESTRRTWSRAPRTTPRKSKPEDYSGSPTTSDYCPSPSYNLAWLPATTPVDTLSHKSFNGSVSSDQGYAESCATPTQSCWTPNNSSPPNRNVLEAPHPKSSSSRTNAKAPFKTYSKRGRVSKKKSNSTLNPLVGKKLRDCLSAGKAKKVSRLAKSKSVESPSENPGTDAGVASKVLQSSNESYPEPSLLKVKPHEKIRTMSPGKPALTLAAYQSRPATSLDQGDQAPCDTVVACVYTAYGCTVRMATAHIMGHEFSCPHQCVRCPAHPCKWYAKLLFFNAHVLTQHLQHVENSPRALFKIKLDLVNSLQIFYQKFGHFIYIFLVKVMDTFVRGQVAYIRTPRHEYNHHYISLEVKFYGKTRNRLTCPVPMFLGPSKELHIPGKKTKLLIKRPPSEDQPSFLELFTEIFVPKVTVNISAREKALADRYAQDMKLISPDGPLTHRMALLKKITEAINCISNTSLNMLRLESKPSVLNKAIEKANENANGITSENIKKKGRPKLTAQACATSLMKEMMTPKIETKSSPIVVKKGAKSTAKSIVTIKINKDGLSNVKKEHQAKSKSTVKSLTKVQSCFSVCSTSKGNKGKTVIKVKSCTPSSNKTKSKSEDSSNTIYARPTLTSKSCANSSSKANEAKSKTTDKRSTNNLKKAKSKTVGEPSFTNTNIENKAKSKSITKSSATDSGCSSLTSKSLSKSTNKENKSESSPKPSGKNSNILSDHPANMKNIRYDANNFSPVILKCWSVVPDEDQSQDLVQSDRPANADRSHEDIPSVDLKSWSVVPDQVQSQELVHNLRRIRIQRVRSESQEEQYRSFYSDSERMGELVNRGSEKYPPDKLLDSASDKLTNSASG